MVAKWGLLVGGFGEVGFWSLMEKEGDWKRDEEAIVETDESCCCFFCDLKGLVVLLLVLTVSE